MRIQRAEQPARLNGQEAARAFFADCFLRRAPGGPRAAHPASPPPANVEQLFVAHLDDQARCLHLSRHDGQVGAVGLPVRDIIRDAARLGSAGIVIAHNHPSGDSTPSVEDCRATRRLATAAEAIDLALVDHLVFAGNDCSSFRRMGLL
ncbi:MAG: JAB domain-containing protein [Paracoccaceae bacterium]